MVNIFIKKNYNRDVMCNLKIWLYCLHHKTTSKCKAPIFITQFISC